MKTVIIDDEPDAVEALELIIEEFLPDLHVVNTFTDPEKALKKLPIINPDLVFLDINMPGLNGFELIEKLENIDFHIIFTTAYDEYAIKAFKFGVANYLLKPIDIDDLISAVNRLLTKEPIAANKLNIQNASIRFKQEKDDKIAINSIDGVHYIKSTEIMYLSAAESSVSIFSSDNKEIIVRKALKDLEKLLPNQFVRIHNSFIINIHFVKKLIKTEQWSIEMNNGNKLPIARRKRSEFMKFMDKAVGKK